MTALLLTLVLAAAETPAVEAYVKELDQQRDALATRLMRSKNKADKKRARAIKNGADFTPELLQRDGSGSMEIRPFGTINYPATVKAIGDQSIVVVIHCGTAPSVVVGGGKSYRVAGNDHKEIVAIEGLDTSAYLVNKPFKTDQVFQRMENKNGYVMLRPFDLAPVQEYQKSRKAKR